MPPEHIGGGQARGASTHTADPAGRIDNPPRPQFGLIALLPDENPITFPLDLPDRERVQGRSARGLPSAQIETGMVPGTADAFAGHEPFGERTVIVAAVGVDGENFRARTYQ